MRRPGRNVTIYDVAARAGVSISTVSLAINAPHRVRDETRARVMAAAGALGYRMAATNGERHSGIRVAVAAPFSSYPSYLRRLTGMLVRARNTAIEITTHDLDSAASSPAPLLDALPVRGGVDGMIVMGVPLSGAALRASRDAGMPVVLVDVRASRRSAATPPVVLVDDVAGGRAIGAHLRGRGHRQAVFVHEPQLSGDYISAAMLRVAGLSEHVDVVDAVCPVGSDAGDIVRATLRAHPAATAVVAHHDDLAARVSRTFSSRGSGRREAVALVGYDDGATAEAIGLTTVRQPFEQSGTVALDLLTQLVAGVGGVPAVTMLDPVLIVRDPTDPERVAP